MDSIILLVCSFFSCVIIVSILFQFLNDRYRKVYENKYLYLSLSVLNIIVVMLANMFMNPVVNLAANALCAAVVSYFFYGEGNSKKVLRVLEAEALLVIIGVSEAFGVYLVDILMDAIGIMPQNLEIRLSLETAFSKMVVLFLYYVIISRIWKKNIIRTKTQYLLYLVMFAYGVLSVLSAAAVSYKGSEVFYILLMGLTIFANMYLLYFIKVSDERGCYKIQIEMMKQQEKLQYEYYKSQWEKNNQTIAILHDVGKHIKMIESLAQAGARDEAIDYAEQISGMLKPLIPAGYTDNAVLDCLLSDKVRLAEKSGVRFKIDIFHSDISFMKPVQITSLFGNLIDNAIAASSKCSEKYIGFFMKDFNNMLSIRVENSIHETVLIKDGKPVRKEQKISYSGIGLLNIQRCVDDYEGIMIYKQLDHRLVCDITLNKNNN